MKWVTEPGIDAENAETNKRRFAMIWGTTGAAQGWSVFSAIFHLGPPASAFMTFVLVISMTLYAFMQKDGLVVRLLLFGIVAGWGELLADAWGVVGNETLHYPDGLKIWCSPWYMPFSWVPVMVQVGWLAVWIERKRGLFVASVVTMLLGSSNIPVYELLAKYQGAWYYDNCHLVFGATPVYVILSEALLCAAMPTILHNTTKCPLWVIPLLGAAQAAWIYIAGNIAFAITG